MTQEAYATQLGQSFRDMREALRLSLEDVGLAMGVSASSVGNWERGVSNISSYNERRLRAFFKAQRDAATRTASTTTEQGKQVSA